MSTYDDQDPAAQRPFAWRKSFKSFRNRRIDVMRGSGKGTRAATKGKGKGNSLPFLRTVKRSFASLRTAGSRRRFLW